MLEDAELPERCQRFLIAIPAVTNVPVPPLGFLLRVGEVLGQVLTLPCRVTAA